jgi:2-desacetyl-2-hydroxyethyl bacteriochlorophyllide A dehydrogenase
VTDVPVPDRDPGSALVKVDQVGICGTDVKVFKGAIDGPRPITMGHEGVGVVIEGPEDGPAPGTRVLVDPATSCGTCDLCWANRPHLCRRGGLLGRDADGVFADYAVVPVERLVPVPDHISSDAAGLLQVLGTCVHAQRAVSIFPGDTVAVIGLGVAGQLMVQLAAARGAEVIGITRSQWKLDMAAGSGAIATATPEQAAERVAELTFGRGADVVIEAAGTERTLGQAIELTRIGGEVLVFGTLTGGSEGLPYYQLYLKELTIHNPRAAITGDYERGIRLAAGGKLHLDQIVTHRLPLESAAEAFDVVNDASSLKVMMDVG